MVAALLCRFICRNPGKFSASMSSRGLLAKALQRGAFSKLGRSLEIWGLQHAAVLDRVLYLKSVPPKHQQFCLLPMIPNVVNGPLQRAHDLMQNLARRADQSIFHGYDPYFFFTDNIMLFRNNYIYMYIYLHRADRLGM